jgi:hypothetical protein
VVVEGRINGPEFGRRTAMKFLCLSLDDPEKLRVPPTPEGWAKIGAFMTEATQSGAIFLTGGVRPREAATRITYEGGKPTVTDGPYAEAKELVAGFAIIDVPTKDEAIHWVTRFAEAANVADMEIRELFLQEEMAG